MIKIGILGDIGSGKSYVSKLFGSPVFSADKEVNKIYKSRTCFNRLKKNLPKYISSFPINKKEISNAVLSSQKNLKRIIEIVHPIVKIKMNNFLKKNKNKKMVILDIPLLLENRINDRNFKLIFVDAKKKEIQKRLKKRINYNARLFNKLKKLQLSLEIKKKKSHFIIKNDFKDSYVKKRVKMIKSKILKNERDSFRYRNNWFIYKRWS